MEHSGHMQLNETIRSGAGFDVVEPSDMMTLCGFRDELLKRTGANSLDDLRGKVSQMPNAEVNQTMVKLLGFTEASSLIATAFSSTVKALCGDQLLLQRRATIIMNLPGDNQRRQWPHYEMMSGISPTTFTLWMPLHDIDDDAGIFYVEDKESNHIMREEYSRGLVNSPQITELLGDRIPSRLKYGQAIVFNPFIIHGNVAFVSNLARIAVSIRFQSLSDPIHQKNTDYFKSFYL